MRDAFNGSAGAEETRGLSTKGMETFIAELLQVNAFVLFVGSRH